MVYTRDLETHARTI